jgi:CheY-like chemotaxis protein
LEATFDIRALGYEGLILGLTGNALDDDVRRFLDAGADCVFAKPFREAQLQTILSLISEYGCDSSTEVRKALAVATDSSGGPLMTPLRTIARPT